MTSAFPDHSIPSLFWGCLACERQNPIPAIRCSGCGRSIRIATDHSIWDKYPPRQYLTLDAVIAPAPSADGPRYDQPCDGDWCVSTCRREDNQWTYSAKTGGEGSDSESEQDVEALCQCEHHQEHEHKPVTEDIADGVVGGGLAHVYVTYCRQCGEEIEPEEPEEDDELPIHAGDFDA